MARQATRQTSSDLYEESLDIFRTTDDPFEAADGEARLADRAADTGPEGKGDVI